MTEELEKTFAEDGSAKIDDMYFRPVSEEDKDKALNDDNPTVTLAIDKNSKARFDVFSRDGGKFLGYLDLFYDRGGYLNFIENRRKADGSYEQRASALTARQLFGMVHFPQTRSEMTYALMEVANILHERNRTISSWKPIGNVGLQQRRKTA